MGNRQAASTNIAHEHSVTNGAAPLTDLTNTVHTKHSKINSGTGQSTLKPSKTSPPEDEKENGASELLTTRPPHTATAAKFKPRKKSKVSKSSSSKPVSVPQSAEALPKAEEKDLPAKDSPLPPPPPPPSTRLLSHSISITLPPHWGPTPPTCHSILSDSSCAAHFSSKTLPPAVILYKQPICVNDDHLYPDAVTPSKVKHCLPQGFYDVPFMDDEAFFRNNWYRLDNNIEVPVRNPIIAYMDELCDSQLDLSAPTPAHVVKRRKKKIPENGVDGNRKSALRPVSLFSCVSKE